LEIIALIDFLIILYISGHTTEKLLVGLKNISLIEGWMEDQEGERMLFLYMSIRLIDGRNNGDEKDSHGVN